jgi:uncharacterized protein YbjT (DUF2867 family)
MNNNLTLDERPIVVLGASGRVGNVVANQLLNAKVKIRAVARHPEKLKDLAEKGAEIWTGVIEEQEFMNIVFTNAKAAFVLTPGDPASLNLHEEQRKNNEHIVEAIKHSGLKHVVFLSSWGAELSEKSGTIFGCYLMEKLLNEIPELNVVHLRAVWFMDNFIYNISLIKMANINGLSIDSDFSFPCIDSNDIGKVAADYLAHINFTGKNIHYLQGSRDYTMREISRILGNSIGNSSLKYFKFPKSVMIQGLKSSGTISDNVAQLLVETNDNINSGRVHGEARNYKNTTPTTLEEFARNKFAPAYNATLTLSFSKKLQGAFLRFYLYFVTKN